MSAATLGESLSVSTPNRGRPTPLKMANTPTSVAAVAGSILMISWATEAEIPMAIRPAREPMT